MTKLYSAAEAASKLNTTSRSLRRVRAIRAKTDQAIGVQVGTVWAFTAEDIDHLRLHVHTRRGNPFFGKIDYRERSVLTKTKCPRADKRKKPKVRKPTAGNSYALFTDRFQKSFRVCY